MSKTKIISFILTAEDIESNLVNEFDTATFEAKNYRHDISEEEACQA
ncbi:MAG: hypothetical protein GWN00_26165, partial [Aliifodinibius sp.]|nr:hypothetical protein [Fodinibius sp.]NIY28160.1 hypothetical protein [Fodinibius sp.]